MADNAALNEAKEVLGGKERNPEELLALAKQLKGQDEFGYAWSILARARRASDLPPELSTLLRQQQALCTYKDTHLNEERRLDRALEILQDGEDLETSTDPETLGLAGAIHKRRWRVRNDKRELETALKHYRRGHQCDRKTEFRAKQGYPGINAAFVQDLLASLETGQSSGATATLVAARRDEAEAIRTEIIDGLPRTMDLAAARTKDDWWPFVTMAEAHFGLRQYGQAHKWLEDAAALPEVDPWEFEATARQLTTLARLVEGQAIDSPAKFEKSDAASVLQAFLGDRVGVLTAYLGKVGLALSGGGFRASLYHIGVLAKLAELDVLRHVEVLSCVSGGSILGAYYYLELRELLQTKADGDITCQDYIDLVMRIEKGFLEGVQENVRMRVMAEFLTNLKMIFFRGYSRTQRIGELYEERIYSKVKDGGQNGERWLTDLFIVPAKEKDFHLRRDNWRRNHKVPILILNATTLNTGHNWQFTASWMGEPPTTVDPDIDSNYRLRRMYYREAPEPHNRMRLGTAVGASACVPGLFEPIELNGLYEHSGGSKIAVRLVDGGVHDNQGVVGLIEQDCDVMLVSDASGQMETDDNPSRGILGVPLRSNSILMSRVREAEYDDVMVRRRAELVRNFMFVHLKMDLEADPVDWIGCDEPHQASDDARPPARRGPLTRYGIRKSVQRLLAAIRTDLDSFNDAEAYALMLSGYRMTEFQYARWIRGFPDAPELKGKPPWRFLEVEPLLKEAKGGAPILRILEVGSATAFKVWNLWTPLKVARVILALAALGGLAWAYVQFRDASLLSVKQIGLFVLGAVLTAVLGKGLMRIVRFRETITKILIGVGMSVVGFLVARIHLHLFDRIYLRLGRLKRLKRS
ncbi:MAG: patatin-like phospholipase family protein [Gemmatimonadetes bacterium]|nr:patatin-like phospholipase family protein [Gemmatimonadota bacterium]